MKVPARRNKDWLRLDNAGKIFPSTYGKKDTSVFRFCSELTEPVDPAALQQAVDRTVEKFPHFLFVLRSGLFWYYLEQSTLRPVVHEENRPLCAPLYVKSGKNLLFDVSYYHNRINLEVYHALSDGTGALQFLKTLTYHYLLLRRDPLRLEEAPVLDYDASLSQRTEDSFQKYYQKGKKENQTVFVDRAYRLTGSEVPPGQYQVVQGIVSCRELLALAAEYGVSLTVLISALLACAIADGMPLRKRRLPVALNIPVNLRKRFPSETARNFFGNIRVKYDFGSGSDALADVACALRDEFERELRMDQLVQRINKLTAFEHNFLIRIAPLPVKNFFLKLARRISDRGDTAVISNIGRVTMPEELASSLERMDVFSSTRSLNLCVCSYEDQLVLSFTSIFTDTDIQRSFFRRLTGRGIAVEIRSNCE
jgi:NRPS condensation-like uncharacterized protein